jgi:TolB-like protein/DNA-binding winged helix-turn-helix (wHTH) protein
MSRKEKNLLQFGQYRIDIAERTLFSGDHRIPLQPKVFDTLLALVQNQGRILEKNDGLEQVWPDTFVEEGSLARNVSTLRKILGETPCGEEYIETVPKRGYRFVAPVIRVTEDTPQTIGGSSDQPSVTVPTRRKRRGLIWATLTATVSVAVVSGWFVLHGRGAREPVRSLVVLPFVNLSGDPGRDYFSDGLTEEIINALAPIPDLRVVARTSSFQFKGKGTDIRKIGATLGVDAVLEGSVRTDGDRVRVTAQFNDARNGFHFWSRSWNHATQDVFAVQQQIALEVFQAINQKSGASIPVTKPLTQSLEAHDYYLQGHHFKDRILEGMLPRAVEAYESAIKADPRFAAAHAQIAQTLIWALQSGKTTSAEALPVIKQHVRRAIELDPELALAHAVQADVSFFADWDFASAERQFQRAIALNPADADARHEFSHFLLAMRRFKEAEIEAERTAEVDPVSIDALTHLQLHFIMVRDTPHAISAAERAQAIDPNAADPLRYLQWTYENSGQFQKAIETAARRPDLAAGVAGSLQGAFDREGETGYWNAWHQAVLQTQMDESARAWEMGVFYSRLGQADEALPWLEKAVRLHYINAVYLNVTPAFDRLRTNAGFQRLVRLIGLPEG